MQRYRLLKDLPGLKAGAILGVDQSNKMDILSMPMGSYMTISKVFMENNPDWFELIDGRWRPNVGQSYYALTDNFEVNLVRWNNDAADNSFYGSYRVFRTSEQAYKAKDQVRKMLLEFHKEINQ